MADPNDPRTFRDPVVPPPPITPVLSYRPPDGPPASRTDARDRYETAMQTKTNNESWYQQQADAALAKGQQYDTVGSGNDMRVILKKGSQNVPLSSLDPSAANAARAGGNTAWTTDENGKSVEVLKIVGSDMPDLKMTQALRAMNSAAAEAAALDKTYKFSAGVDNVSSYLKAEGAKQNEVERQLSDFINRAKSVYSLQDAEQGYALKADQANSANEAALHKGADVLDQQWFSPYRPLPAGQEPYGYELAQSVPNYVLPDYRMNQAVGLPGAEGFDQGNGNMRNYNIPNTPGYADGTPHIGGISPEIAFLIGKPDWQLTDKTKIPNLPLIPNRPVVQR